MSVTFRKGLLLVVKWCIRSWRRREGSHKSRSEAQLLFNTFSYSILQLALELGWVAFALLYWKVVVNFKFWGRSLKLYLFWLIPFAVFLEAILIIITENVQLLRDRRTEKRAWKISILQRKTIVSFLAAAKIRLKGNKVKRKLHVCELMTKTNTQLQKAFSATMESLPRSGEVSWSSRDKFAHSCRSNCHGLCLHSKKKQIF